MVTKHRDKVILDGSYFVRRTDVLDAPTLRADVRQADYDEWRYSILGGVAHLETCIITSSECWTVADEMDRAILITGVVEDPGQFGDVVWLIGTTASDRVGSALMHAAKPMFDDFFTRWPKTTCMSWGENTKHHRWLLWLGYKLAAAEPMGPENKTFFRFIRNK